MLIPSAPSSSKISALSVVYHSQTFQFASVGLHSIDLVTPEPSHAVAVNTTLPAFLNVTRPVYVSISATSVSDEDQTTDLFVASLFNTADNVTATPTVSTFELLVISRDETGVASAIVGSGVTTILVIYVVPFAVITTSLAFAS